MEAADFSRLFDYDLWANHECIAAMRLVGNALQADTIGRVAHILSAQRLWLERILSEAQTLPVWPTFTMEECRERVAEIGTAWRNFLKEVANQTASARPSRSLQDNVKYRNTKGDVFTSRVEDILMHVLFHSTYHRGQIALQLRSAGFTPAYTDFIHAVREGFVE